LAGVATPSHLIFHREAVDEATYSAVIQNRDQNKKPPQWFFGIDSQNRRPRALGDISNAPAAPGSLKRPASDFNRSGSMFYWS